MNANESAQNPAPLVQPKDMVGFNRFCGAWGYARR